MSKATGRKESAAKGARNPGNAQIQAHAADRGRSTYYPGLGLHFGGSGVPRLNPGASARLYQPLPKGM